MDYAEMVRDLLRHTECSASLARRLSSEPDAIELERVGKALETERARLARLQVQIRTEIERLRSEGVTL